MTVHRLRLSFACIIISLFPIHACAVKPSSDAGFKASNSLVYEIVRMHTHDADHFTQGLELSGSNMLESVGRYGVSALIEAQIGNGKVLRRHDLPDDVFAEGLTAMGDRIYQLSWREQRLFVYDRELRLLARRAYEGEGWGLANDGRQLIMSDGSARLYFRSADDFRVLRSVEVHDGVQRIARLNELEYVEGLVFANVWLTDRIAVIDPADGAVLGWLDLRGLRERMSLTNVDAVLNGIAYDARRQRLYVTGKLWPQLFELRLGALPKPSATR